MILVFGKDGQVAQALKFELPSDTVFISSQEANFKNESSIISQLNMYKPKLIINASAYTAVDLAENEKSKCLQINAHALTPISEWCSANRCQLIHFSTDYVFDGSGDQPWLESSSTSPVNYYGYSKLEGEKNIRKTMKDYYIFRISWVYAPWGKNFAKTIAKLAQEKDELKIINDQIGSPTDAREVAHFISLIYKDILAYKFQAGTYHLKFKNYTSWYEFALNVIEEARNKGLAIKVKNVLPISTSQYPTAAKRPHNSRLETEFDFIKKLCLATQKHAKEMKWGNLD